MPLLLPDAPNLGVAPSASKVIAKHLSEAIISVHFAEDEPIRQDDIAKVFNVSKIPVREALKRLEAEGLVQFQRNKGAVVTRIPEPELAQIFEVRVLLEVQAIRLAVPKMTQDTLVCRCEDMSFAALAGHSDWKHAKLATHCGMGACQGRICSTATQTLFGWEPPAARPPFSPARVDGDGTFVRINPNPLISLERGLPAKRPGHPKQFWGQ